MPSGQGRQGGLPHENHQRGVHSTWTGLPSKAPQGPQGGLVMGTALRMGILAWGR